MLMAITNKEKADRENYFRDLSLIMLVFQLHIKGMREMTLNQMWTTMCVTAIPIREAAMSAKDETGLCQQKRNDVGAWSNFVWI